MVEYARSTLIIPTTGNPKIVEPLFESIIKNTKGSYSVWAIKQQIQHEDAEECYEKWQGKKPLWNFIPGNDNMILSARNIGLLDSYIPYNHIEPERWYFEMDDDIVLPPNWDEDIIRNAETKPDGAIFVPLMTFKSDLNYKDQVVALPKLIWEAMENGNVEMISDFYSKTLQTDKIKLKQCILPEYSFIMRSNKYLLPLLWDTAFDVVRNASRANEDLMLRLHKLQAKAYIIRTVIIFHYARHRDEKHPLRHFCAGTLSEYFEEKHGKPGNVLLKKALRSNGDHYKKHHAQVNMVKKVKDHWLLSYKKG